MGAYVTFTSLAARSARVCAPQTSQQINNYY
jgi:hypothetical protein